jgi:ABC-type Fe3+ transport system permease subunit
MIRFVFRFVGLLILAAGFIALVYDGTKSIAGGAVAFTPLGQHWNNFHSTSLQLLQPAIERHVAEWLWDPVVLTILTTPACLVLGVIGAILMLIGRKKKPLIGYARD